MERKGVFVSACSPVAFDQTSELIAPLIGQVTYAQIESFVFGVISAGDTFTGQEIMKAAEV
jgi:hypothetical protein